MDLSEFKCLKCGECCRQKGYVRLKKKEADKIAKFLGLDIYQFTQTYTIVTRDRQTLSFKDKDKTTECIFLSSNGCRINEVKPAQCLEFPRHWRFKAFKNICALAIKKCKTG